MARYFLVKLYTENDDDSLEFITNDICQEINCCSTCFDVVSIKDITIDEEQSMPIVGIKPRYVLREERINEILCAMERYSEAHIPIPVEWVDELRDWLS